MEQGMVGIPGSPSTTRRKASSSAPFCLISNSPQRATDSVLQLTCSRSALWHPLLLHMVAVAPPLRDRYYKYWHQRPPLPGATGTRALLLYVAGAIGIYFSFFVSFLSILSLYLYMYYTI